jgi:hypothetical protein
LSNCYETRWYFKQNCCFSGVGVLSAKIENFQSHKSDLSN